MISSLLWSLPRFGRRKPLLAMLAFCTVALVTCALIAGTNTDSKNVNLIRTIAALGGKSLSGTLIIVMILYTAELYPTILRNIGFGVAMFWCRLGAMVAPQLFFVGKKTSIVIPYIITGILLLFSSILVLFLPETFQQVLAERFRQKGEDDCEDQSEKTKDRDNLLESNL
ncbi:solute carrier family 22 member 8-like [Xenia sp. Carnegie-2017]|uniref:solute carrier family 22 member 8-like n=1 Tax=Xenia sp. Carnegie-2017 TaxID=2897299 RepID=UPI001F03ADB5|nr:solute carrier family 22 member 8-like [Xenia sp. Carnegie-2017]